MWMNKILHVGGPNLGNRKKLDRHIDGIWERRWLTNNGQLVQELERKLCAYLGVRHCIPVSNGTLGLQLAIKALGLSGEVLTTPYSFVATSHAILWENCRPVFIDIDAKTHNINPQAIESAVTAETSAILGVHVWGNPCAVEAIEDIAKRKNLKVIYDAAHAFGVGHGGRMIGNFGECEVFSLHATKFFNTCEGGAIATNNNELAAKIRLMQNFGFSGYDQVDYLGTNAKMSELHAAMGLCCFDELERIVETNKRHYLQYQRELSSLEGVRFFTYNEKETANFQYIVLEIDSRKAGCTRDELQQYLQQNEVMARRYFYPGIPRMEPYRTLFPGFVDACPACNQLCDDVLILPTGTSLDSDDVERVCSLIRKRLGRA